MLSRVYRLAGLAGLAAMLAGCNSAGTAGVEDTLDVSQPANQQVTGLPKEDQVQDPRAFCPKAVIRAGTETFNVYPQGVDPEEAGSSAKLRWRSTISEVARECNSAGEFLNIRVGVRGRYLSGPSGETGIFTMPVRVAAVQGDTVLYSKLHQIPAEIPPGRLNGTFAYVDNEVSIPKPEGKNIVIYVGFDEGPYDTQ
jgi:hypothetical protein